MNDDNRNLITAMVLSLLVIVGYYAFFAPQPPAPVEGEAAVQNAAEPALPTAVATDAAPVDAAQPAPKAARLKIESPMVEGSITLSGGRIDDLALRDYRETLDPDAPLVRLLSPTPDLRVEDAGTPVAPGGNNELVVQRPYYAVYGWSPAAGTDPAALPGPSTLWQIESGETLAPDQPVTLRWDNGQGQIFRRVFALDDRFMFTVTQSVENTAATPFSAAPYAIVARIGRPDTQNFFILHEGAIGMAEGVMAQESYKDMSKFDGVTGEGQAVVTSAPTGGWVGFTDKYWMTAIARPEGQPFTSVMKYSPAQDIYQTEARLPLVTIAPGTTAQEVSYLFAGAKVYETLNSYQKDLGIERFVDAIDWGWFFFFTKPIFHGLHALHALIGNMGFAIIALTFVLKILTFPLARKSYISMAKMRELQPQMEALKERVGDDKMRYQKEVMELYKREKVNPAAGCLPVLIQIPIFFSLYKVIFVTIELRHAPWLGWIRDLSAPDPSSILNLFGLLPYAAPARDSILGIVSLSIMAIILGLSMWVQQKLNPAPTDATQKMIFAWMPWIFMFMLGGFASGLVLYWITNNVITIIQQYTIMSMHGHPPQLFGNIKDSFRRDRSK